MYCSNCGTPASGNFCSACGARLNARTPGQPPPLPSRAMQAWKDEIRYDVLLFFPEVRDLIAKNAAQAKKGLTGEKFLELADKALVPLTHVSLGTVASIVVPLSTLMGIHTGKKREKELQMPVGKVLVAAVCSLARHGRHLKNVQQGTDGCVLEAVLPSDLWSFEGELVITVERQGAMTRVDGATNIPAQNYDWGKSDKCLDQLFEDLETLVA